MSSHIVLKQSASFLAATVFITKEGPHESILVDQSINLLYSLVGNKRPQNFHTQLCLRYLPVLVQSCLVVAATRSALEWMIGCVHHKPKKSKSKAKAMTIEEQLARVRNRFKVLHCSASVDQCETIIKENAATLNYVTPHFRAEAEVEVPRLKEGEIYTVGWVQAVTEMKFYNHYPSGVSSWEIQELNNGQSEAVSDADGRQYPWYGITTERVTLKGPENEQTVRVYMNDNFSPTVSWAIPVGREQPDTLQKVYRDQSFVAWLILKNEINGEITPLQAYSWRAVINIAVNCSQKVGERATLLEPLLQDPPQKLAGVYLPKSALMSPRANEAQKFVWRTLDSELIFEVSCTPTISPSSSLSSLQQCSSISDSRYPSRYAPY